MGDWIRDQWLALATAGVVALLVLVLEIGVPR